MSGTMLIIRFSTPPLPGMFGFESRTNAPHASCGFSLAGSGEPPKPHDHYRHDAGRWPDRAPAPGILAGLLDGLGALPVYARQAGAGMVVGAGSGF